MIKENLLRKKLLEGGKAYGAFFDGNEVYAEVLARLGLDFIVIDCEHGPLEPSDAIPVIKAVEPLDMAPLVRVKQADRTSILKMLDSGAAGLFVPFVKTPEEARTIVNYAKYRPVGDRGFGFTHANGYGHEPRLVSDPFEYFKWSNEQTLLILQCETAEFLENIEEIVNIEGVDGIFIGDYDLSVALDIPKQFGDKRFIAAWEKAVNACKAAGKLVFGIGGPAPRIRQRFEAGMDASVSSDISLLSAGYAAFKASLQKEGLLP